ncbi:LysM peptidoglycan-binding domain-containing protein [Weissella soli]|uniref:LysM peptidoglycan-binding domain-containing protein n=1 Tax=Weissella soli TaxID=155866 RepID=UPI0021C0DD64|nr:LysM peptidoglycan-binding domain-containing protein [Weissella soli]MCT8395567.1 LysM peptidoglycan-binding domain-containing protein [Weissella soli]
MQNEGKKKLYKSGKFWVAAAASVVGAVVPFTDQPKASADTWTANTVDQVAANYDSGSSYTVHSGDTLSSIAGATGVSVSNLAANNDMSTTDYLYVGQTLKITTTSATTTTATSVSADATSYTVQSGDYLSKIAVATGVSVDNLVSYNNLGSQNTIIYAGQVLKLTGSAAKATTTTATTSSSASSTTTTATKQTTTTSTTASTAGTFSEALSTLNALRAQHGLSPVSYDASLAATAQMRANMLKGTVDAAHWAQSYGYEVIAIQFGSGAAAINAWYNETNMQSASGTGHRDWELSASITKVGFGYDAATGTFVGEAK